jgi:hypothetical protein
MDLYPKTSTTLFRVGFKEEESMHQFDEEMEPVSQEGELVSTSLEDAASHYAQCLFKCVLGL